jgi:hypothetical protein
VIGLGLRPFGQLPIRLSLLRSARRPSMDVRSPAVTYTHGRTKVVGGGADRSAR